MYFVCRAHTRSMRVSVCIKDIFAVYLFDCTNTSCWFHSAFAHRALLVDTLWESCASSLLKILARPGADKHINCILTVSILPHRLYIFSRLYSSHLLCCALLQRARSYESTPDADACTTPRVVTNSMDVVSWETVNSCSNNRGGSADGGPAGSSGSCAQSASTW